MERSEDGADEVRRVGAAMAEHESVARPGVLNRIPVRKRDELTFVAVDEIASVVAEGSACTCSR
jgi:hypothetical protein